MSKAIILSIFSTALFLVLGFRLFQLQVLEHDRYKILAKNNSTRVSILRAPRGIIYDRNGKILATSKQSLSVVVYPALLRLLEQKEIAARALSEILELNFDDLFKLFEEMDPTTPLPLTIDRDIAIEDAIKIFENAHSLPGVSVEKQATRYYPYAEIGSHFLGYVGQANNEELKASKTRAISLGDVIGKEGLEKSFDLKLRGDKGEERVAVDRYGRILTAGLNSKNGRTFRQAKKGGDLHLTIDIELQKVAEEAMGDLAGAAVVINPQNGEILALVSRPGFDPNLFTKPIPTAIYREMLEEKAFLNRALSAFTPGSIWKPLTALAALEHNVASGTEILTVSGSIMMGGFRFGDWTSKQDRMDLVTALAWSRDTYFYQIAKRMKPEWMAELGRKFGAGEITNIELQGEHKGIVPDSNWKKKNMKEPWFPGNTLHYSIGQSFLLLTPLQAVKLISSIAMNGSVPRLHLVKNPEKDKPERIVHLNPVNLEIVKEGLRKCVREGTGGASQVPGIVLAGKTGSAEVKGYRHSTHAWFTAYGPAGPEDTPEIALVVFGEGAGHGGNISAPVAQKIFAKYFGL